MAKSRVHNEWFQPIAKTTCACGATKTHRAKLGLCETVFSWGEYHHASWRTVDYCCQACFGERILPRLINHASECGCSFVLLPRTGHAIPAWIKMPEANAPFGATCQIQEVA